MGRPRPAGASGRARQRGLVR